MEVFRGSAIAQIDVISRNRRTKKSCGLAADYHKLHAETLQMFGEFNQKRFGGVVGHNHSESEYRVRAVPLTSSAPWALIGAHNEAAKDRRHFHRTHRNSSVPAEGGVSLRGK